MKLSVSELIECLILKPEINSFKIEYFISLKKSIILLILALFSFNCSIIKLVHYNSSNFFMTDLFFCILLLNCILFCFILFEFWMLAQRFSNIRTKEIFKAQALGYSPLILAAPAMILSIKISFAAPIVIVIFWAFALKIKLLAVITWLPILEVLKIYTVSIFRYLFYLILLVLIFIWFSFVFVIFQNLM